MYLLAPGDALVGRGPAFPDEFELYRIMPAGKIQTRYHQDGIKWDYEY
jgi:hypothetical protein